LEINSLQRRYLHKGFSLTELMASIVIVGVLMAIVIPNYKNIRFGADETKATVNLHSMYMAEKEYRSDNGEYGDIADTNELQTYVDFSIDDKSWTYQIESAVTNADGSQVFLIRAYNTAFPTREMTIDQAGTITKNY